MNLSHALRGDARKVADAGQHGDTQIIHVNKHELPVVDAVLRALGGSGTINPKTGMREYYGESRDHQDTTGGGSHDAHGGGGSRDGRAGGSGRADRDQQSNTVADAGQRAIGSNNGREAGPGGGTYTSYGYTPGAVPNFPDADPLSNLATAAVYGPMGMATRVLGQAVGVSDASPFSDTGPQRGWAPDRSHGVVNGVGGATAGPLNALRVVPTRATTGYDTLLRSLTAPKIYSSNDAVITR